MLLWTLNQSQGDSFYQYSIDFLRARTELEVNGSSMDQEK